MQNVFVENIDNTDNISIENSSVEYTIVVESVEEANVVAELPSNGPSNVVIDYSPGTEYEIVIEHAIKNVSELGLPSATEDGQILASLLDGTLYWTDQYIHPNYSALGIDAITGQVIDTIITNDTGHVTDITLRYLQIADIPNLPISKIINLQTELDNRYTEAELQGDGTAEVHWNNLTNVPASITGDHGDLTGLSDDDHSQYALLTGRDGDILLVDTLNEFTTDAGVTIESVLIKDGHINWNYISSTPTTLSGYGITDAYTQTQLQTSGQSSVHWDNITNTPTTEAGYGILDGFTSWDKDYNDLINKPTLLTSPLTTKGDIWVYSSSNVKLPAGTDGQILSSDSSEATGLKWIAAPSGSGVSFGLQYQIPYTNSSTNDFDYSNNLSFNGDTLVVLDSGSTNTFIGYNVAINRLSGDYNTFIGRYVNGGGVTTGSYNTIVGNAAGYQLTSGVSNTLYGDSSGQNITSGSFNTLIGKNSGSVGLTTTSYNTGLGYESLYTCIGNGNIALGYQAARNESSIYNKLFIDNQARSIGNASVYSLIYGNFDAAVMNQYVRINGVLQIPDDIGTAPGTVSGYAQIYVDPTTGDLTVKFGDGTVKTIVTDS